VTQSNVPSSSVAAADDALREPFRNWLAKEWPEVADLEVLPIESPKSGFSARTLMVPLRYRRDGQLCEERVVLRLENPEPAIYPQQAPGLDTEIDIQYRTMEALARAEVVPLAGLVGYEGDASVLGAPFYAMRFVKGEVPVENPIYTSDAFFFDACPRDRRKLIENGIRTMAAVHSLDWRAAGFDWLVPEGVEPSIERQVDLWEDYLRRELGTREHPIAERGIAYLRANMPHGLEPALSWGDSRPGNIIWRDFEPVCVTDFENVAVAPPEFDLGWWLMFDHWSHETYMLPRLD